MICFYRLKRDAITKFQPFGSKKNEIWSSDSSAFIVKMSLAFIHLRTFETEIMFSPIEHDLSTLKCSNPSDLRKSETSDTWDESIDWMLIPLKKVKIFLRL